jgi:hypothetical protein
VRTYGGNFEASCKRQKQERLKVKVSDIVTEYTFQSLLQASGLECPAARHCGTSQPQAFTARSDHAITGAATRSASLCRVLHDDHQCCVQLLSSYCRHPWFWQPHRPSQPVVSRRYRCQSTGCADHSIAFATHTPVTSVFNCFNALAIVVKNQQLSTTKAFHPCMISAMS